MCVCTHIRTHINTYIPKKNQKNQKNHTYIQATGSYLTDPQPRTLPGPGTDTNWQSVYMHQGGAGKKKS